MIDTFNYLQGRHQRENGNTGHFPSLCKFIYTNVVVMMEVIALFCIRVITEAIFLKGLSPEHRSANCVPRSPRIRTGIGG